MNTNVINNEDKSFWEMGKICGFNKVILKNAKMLLLAKQKMALRRLKEHSHVKAKCSIIFTIYFVYKREKPSFDP